VIFFEDFFRKKAVAVAEQGVKLGRIGAGSGSGRVAVVALDRGDQGGSNGTG
jgi:hypothetical protein